MRNIQPKGICIMKKVISFLSLFFCLSSFAHAQESKLDLAPKTQGIPTENMVAGSTKNSCTLTNTWKPYFARVSTLQPRTSTFFQTNVGIGFLYFSGIRGNLQPGGAEWQSYLKNDTPIQGSLNYNKTPLYEAVFGYQANNWMSVGLSFQAQTDVSIYSNWQLSQTNIPGVGSLTPRSKLESEVNLYGIAAKVYFNLPYSLIVKMMAFNPYLAVGVGPCWQTWKNIAINNISGQGPLSNTNAEYASLFLNQKISANCMFIADLGVKAQWMIKKFSFTVTKGIKFNIWGQARSIGKNNDQDYVASQVFANNPPRIKTVYQFAPYLGLQWNY